MSHTDTADKRLTAQAGIGRVKIASDVLARIAGIAALDVEGVHAVGAGLNREAVSKVGRNSLLKGVKVALDGGLFAALLFRVFPPRRGFARIGRTA